MSTQKGMEFNHNQYNSSEFGWGTCDCTPETYFEQLLPYLASENQYHAKMFCKMLTQIDYHMHKCEDIKEMAEHIEKMYHLVLSSTGKERALVDMIYTFADINGKDRKW